MQMRAYRARADSSRSESHGGDIVQTPQTVEGSETRFSVHNPEIKSHPTTVELEYQGYSSMTGTFDYCGDVLQFWRVSNFLQLNNAIAYILSRIIKVHFQHFTQLH
jgi:hypothetical protein